MKNSVWSRSVVLMQECNPMMTKAARGGETDLKMVTRGSCRSACCQLTGSTLALLKQNRQVWCSLSVKWKTCPGLIGKTREGQQEGCAVCLRMSDITITAPLRSVLQSQISSEICPQIWWCMSPEVRGELFICYTLVCLCIWHPQKKTAIDMITIVFISVQ